MSRPWVLPFAYVAFAHRAYCLGEFLWCGGTFKGWCNDQRMWTFKRTTSFFFAFFDTILKLLGYPKSAFAITAKVADDDVLKRYEQELIEFGATSPMFDILATLAIINLFSSFGAIKKIILDADQYYECWTIWVANFPLFAFGYNQFSYIRSTLFPKETAVECLVLLLSSQFFLHCSPVH
ncbi:hypothetical protein DITRI_Ditri20bG0057600 [Diplodiscus trichospermus]